MREVSAMHTAEGLLAQQEPRWSHVRGVAAVAERITTLAGWGRDVVDAAWLHDIGYGPTVSQTGFHPLDGASFLAREGFSENIVGLVAFHTGAEFEAQERSLLGELHRFRRPDQAELDALILADLSVSPEGARVHPKARIAEILDRYSTSDPVHRAVTRSREYLLACATRAALATGSPDEWGFAAA
ncbi:HD domain-containing protein [Pedococcus sp. NPDC057267]|uniref:HD domain-containing protein n=1 Tax=Pedococcus sp. NPDC057267 TaxID=3346077 RepID=UPI003631D793